MSVLLVVFYNISVWHCYFINRFCLIRHETAKRFLSIDVYLLIHDVVRGTKDSTILNQCEPASSPSSLVTVRIMVQ